MIRVLVTKSFTDIHTGERHEPMEIIDVESVERLRNIVDLKLGTLESIDCRSGIKRDGKQIIIFQKLLYVIGGIESWGYNLAKTFKNRKIKFIFQSADIDQAIRLSKFADIEMDAPWKTYNCDVFISANYDGGPAILNRISARKRYQTIHSDFSTMKERVSGWSSFNLDLDRRFDRVLAASQTACNGLEKAFGIESVVVDNPLARSDEKPVVFLTLSRATEEKGVDKVITMAREFARREKNFIWLVASTLDVNNRYKKELEAIKQVVIVPPNLYAQNLLAGATYLCQFSISEAYCYSMHEALAMGVPVLATRFNEAEKWIKDGENGYLLEHDLSDFDDEWVEKVFSKIPTGFEHKEKISPKWAKVMKGEL